MNTAQSFRVLCIAGAMWLGLPVEGAPAIAQEQKVTTAAKSPHRIGAIKSLNGVTITLTPNSGPDLNVILQSTTRILRVAPGEKDLKNASPIQPQDLQVGDRILAGGVESSDGSFLLASSIVVMKHSDVEARHQQDLQDWQKRGVGGLVTASDAAAGTVTISVTGFGSSKSIAVHTTNDTTIRRYAPDSVKFDDAKPSTLAEVHSGDQLRARGERSADGTEFAAAEIVSGSFRNTAGTVNSVDAGAATITVQDLHSKKVVVVKVTPDSQLRQLPAEMAQRIATRFKSAALGSGPDAPGSADPGKGQMARPTAAPGGTGLSGGGTAASNGMGGTGGGRGGAPDFQQMLSRVPAITLADLHKGDAVLIVSTEGASGRGGTVITLVSGVDPILQSVPSASQATMLAPWSLSAPEGGSQ